MLRHLAIPPFVVFQEFKEHSSFFLLEATDEIHSSIFMAVIVEMISGWSWKLAKHLLQHIGDDRLNIVTHVDHDGSIFCEVELHSEVLVHLVTRYNQRSILSELRSSSR